MALWSKVNTLFRASAREPVESLIKANDIRIFEQEIVDSEQHLHQAKLQLAQIVMEKRQLERHNEALKSNIATREKQAIAAMEKQQSRLAEDLAALIATDESFLASQTDQITQLARQELLLKQQIQCAANKIIRYRRELTLAKASRSTRQTLHGLQGASNGLYSSIQEMETSLVAIQTRHSRMQDFDQALMEINADLNGESIEGRLDAAGIATGSVNAKTQSVLARLQTQAATASA
jgi:phage shock protein A